MIAGIDHVSLPLVDADAMVAFYRALGFEVLQQPALVSVTAGGQMINFHRPAIWQREGFTLRAPAAVPPCGDVCFVWDDDEPALLSLLDQCGATIEEGPVPRTGGRGVEGTSVYVRDPDGNLLEFLTYTGSSTTGSGAG